MGFFYIYSILLITILEADSVYIILIVCIYVLFCALPNKRFDVFLKSVPSDAFNLNQLNIVWIKNKFFLFTHWFHIETNISKIEIKFCLTKINFRKKHDLL